MLDSFNFTPAVKSEKNAIRSLSFPRRRESITQCHMPHCMGSRFRGNDSDGVETLVGCALAFGFSETAA